jgi:parvulin-like peptidyl-prolyl isomerase
VYKRQTIEDFEAIVFDLKPGTVSQPFPTRLGYHIVEILNKGPDWVLLRQILIKVEISRQDTLRVERQANELKELVMQGADFDSLAKQYSKDPSIDLGEFYVDRLTPPFNEVVKDMAEGEVSEPILTPYGYHLLYVREKVPQRMLSFEELRDQIMQYLYQQEVQEKYDELIGELKQRTFVKKLSPT